jgi:hypothetical protein
MRLYARWGLGHLWFVDPIVRTLELALARSWLPAAPAP